MDTGSAVSILDKWTFTKHLSNYDIKVRTPPKQLLDYNRRPISVLGCFTSPTTVEENEANILLYVVAQGKTLKLVISGETLQCLSSHREGDIVHHPQTSSYLPAAFGVQSASSSLPQDCPDAPRKCLRSVSKQGQPHLQEKANNAQDESMLTQVKSDIADIMHSAELSCTKVRSCV